MLARADESISVTNFNGQMAIATKEGPIIITRKQVIEFFNLPEKDSKR